MLRPTAVRAQRAVLLRRLESAGEPLVLVVALSGLGKTTLLEQWATTTGAQVAWLYCDESAGEPARFWSRLTASLLRAVGLPQNALPGDPVRGAAG